MIEIKFRAWDKIKKEMIYDIQDCYDSEKCNSFGYFLHATLLDGIGGYDITDLDENQYEEKRYIVAQHNWRIDKNKKEIYEGDILKAKYGYHTIKFDDKPPYKFPERIKKIGYYITIATMSGFIIPSDTIDWDWYDEKDIEIIGNIYENPELLEELDE